MSFATTLTSIMSFPVASLGMCAEGSERMANTYRAKGYEVRFLYNKPSASSQGHIWIQVRDPATNQWQAVDSYYGPVSSSEYSHADHIFSSFGELDNLVPKIRGFSREAIKKMSRAEYEKNRDEIMKSMAAGMIY